MSAYTFVPEGICTTCLAQGRKIYPFPTLHAIPFHMFYKDFGLAGRNMICWECKRFIHRMVEFRQKAMLAQSALMRMPFEEPVVFQSLSKLAVSAGIYLDIQQEPQEDPLLIKTEEVKVEESEEVEPDLEPVNSDVLKSDDSDLGYAEQFQVFQHKRLVAPESIYQNNVVPECGNQKYFGTEEGGLGNATLKSLLSRKSNQLIFPPLQYETPAPTLPVEKPTVPVEIKDEIDIEEHIPIPEPILKPVSQQIGVQQPDWQQTVTQNPIWQHSVVHKPDSQHIGILNPIYQPIFIVQPPLSQQIDIQTPVWQPIPIRKQFLQQVDIKKPDSQPVSKQTVTQKPVSEQTVAQKPNSQQIFTELRLTEEEMRRWWESKRENEFYQKSIPVFRCEKCVEPFWTRRSYLGHVKMHTEEYGVISCDICQLRFYTESALAAHRDNHYILLQCGHCAHQWDNPNSMRRHCNTEHQLPCVTVWSCIVCPRQLRTYVRYLNHLRTHSSVPCPDCGRRVSVVRLKAHQLTHANISEHKYECADCGAKFRTKTSVSIHLKHVHYPKRLDPKAFCTQCDKQFRTVSSFKNHIKYSSKHCSEQQLRHKCSICAEGFVAAALLRRHVEAKHTELCNYPCRLCPARFRNPTTRRRHRRVVHEGYIEPRDKMCDHCGKAFKTKIQLLNHMNTHTGARPYVCKVCKAAFGHKSALYLHGRYKHKIPKKDASNV